MVFKNTAIVFTRLLYNPPRHDGNNLINYELSAASLHGLWPGVDAHPLGQVCTAFGQVCTTLDAAVALGKKGGKRGGGADRAGRGGQGGTGFSY